MKKTITVSDDSAGSRADKFVGKALELSRTRLKQLFDTGLVRVGGRRAVKGMTLSAGSVIEIDLPEEPGELTQAPQIPLSVLYEDEDIVIVDKPAGIPVHPLSFSEEGTLAQALLARYPECAEASPAAPLECGIAHRLDTETSGAVIAGRRPEIYAALRGMFSSGKIDKYYTALVGGMLPAEGEVAFPVAHHASDKARMEACPDDASARVLKARPATTHWEILRWYGDFAIVRLKILTGVRHQIRVHMSSIGAPIAGDFLYGGTPLYGLKRQFLHASRVSFEHPVTGMNISAEAPLPEDLSEVLRRLAEPSQK